MVKCIPVTELRLGMYVHKLGGSWLKHPFLRGSFLLTDLQDITLIRECGIEDVWIDVAKGQAAQSPEPRAQSPEPRAQKIVGSAIPAV